MSEILTPVRTLDSRGRIEAFEIMSCPRLDQLLPPVHCSGILEIVTSHGDQDHLLLGRIDVFNDAFVQKIVPDHPITAVCRCLNLVDVFSLEPGGLRRLVDDQKWSTDSACIRVDPQLSFSNITND